MNDIGILPKYKGVLVHDFWSSYYSYDEFNHGVCNAHILRELKAEHERGSIQADQMISLLIEIKSAVDNSIVNKVSANQYSHFRKRYRKIINQAIKNLPPPEINRRRGRTKKGISLCLWERLLNYENEVLLFSKEELVPFDNNQAERDLRMFKVKMKISGCFRNIKSAEHFTIIRSVISTLKKQGYSILDGISLFMQGLNPDILPE
jgi:transposase